MFLLCIGHPLSVPASRMTYDNDPSMPHLRPHKTKPGACVAGAEGGDMNVFVCMEDPCLCWVTGLNFSWYRRADGGVQREEGSLSSRFIFLLLSRTTCLSMCLPSRPLLNSEKTIRTHRKLQYRQTVQTVIARNSTSSIGSYRIWSRDKRRPGALRRGSLAGVRCWSHPPHTHRAPGKQPADRKSSLSNTSKTVTSDSWPQSQQIPPPSSHPPSETHTHTNTRLHFLLCFGYISCNCMQLAKTFLLHGVS